MMAKSTAKIVTKMSMEYTQEDQDLELCQELIQGPLQDHTPGQE